jgi:hypothetical protein
MIKEYIGSATRDITPDFPLPMGGYGQRVTPSEGMRDSIFVSALCIGETNPLIIVTSDLIATAAPVRHAVVQQVEELIGVSPDRIILTASHTHSGPVPFDPSPSASATHQFSQLLITSMVECVVSAFENQRDAVLVSFAGDVQIGFNRWRPDDRTQVDTRVPILVALDSTSNTPFAILFGAGCHPTTFGWDNMFISADYPGVAKRLVAKAFPGCDTLFFNTTEGDVVPLTSARTDALDPRGYTGTDQKNADDIGALLAAEVIRCVRELVLEVPDQISGTLLISSFNMQLQANSAGLDAESSQRRMAEATAVLENYLGSDFSQRIHPGTLWAETSRAVTDNNLDEDEMREIMIAGCFYLGLLARSARGGTNPPVDALIQVAVIDSMNLLALPGEVLVALGRKWTELTATESSFVVGLANAHFRYLPMQHHFEEMGADKRYETVTAGVAPGEIDRVIEQSARTLKTLTSTG